MQILVIDDDVDIGEFISAAAQNLGFSCIVTTNVADFLAAINPDVTLIMMDLIIPEMDGIELLRILGQQQCKSKIVLMSGVDKRVLETAQNLTHSLDLAVVGILQKPFRLVELEECLKTNVNISNSNAIKTAAPVADNTIGSFTKSELQQALAKEEFVLYYQPQIEISTGHIVGLEALVRWQHSKHGLIYPDSFIGLLESYDLIDPLGWLVAKKSLSEFKQFANIDGSSPTVSINVSPYSLHDLQFPDILNALARQREVAPSNFTLEITESALFKDLTSVLDILTRLRMKQFQLSIDDFGTGYAMMEQLQNVPANELKIDRSLVGKIDSNESTQIMIKKIIEMGHELGMRIVAEGVETASQLEFLRINKCDVAQGYLYSRPLPVSELLLWIKNYNNSQQI